MGVLAESLSVQAVRGTARLRERLRGIEDAEYFWEPVPGCWNVRRREDAWSERPEGVGEWVFDYIDFAQGDPSPAPFTTIAWRLMHLTDVIGGYHSPLWGEKGLAEPWPGSPSRGR